MNIQHTEIITPRLLLKNISFDDIDFIYNQFTNDFINRFLFDAEPLTSEEEASQIIEFYTLAKPKLQHRWIITLIDNKTKIGSCGYHNWDVENNTCEIGYDLLEEYNGNGFMDEAIKRVVDFCIKTLCVKKIYATIYYDNVKSRRLIEKNGFLKNGTKMEIFRNQEYLHDLYVLERS